MQAMGEISFLQVLLVPLRTDMNASALLPLLCRHRCRHLGKKNLHVPCQKCVHVWMNQPHRTKVMSIGTFAHRRSRLVTVASQSDTRKSFLPSIWCSQI